MIAGSRDILVVAPLATLLGIVARHVARARARATSRGSSTTSSSRIIDAFLATPADHHRGHGRSPRSATRRCTLILAIGARLHAARSARTVRAAVLVERELDYVQAAKLRGERAPYIMFVEILPNVIGADHRRGDGPARLRDLHRRRAQLPRLRRPAAVARLGRCRSPHNYTPDLDSATGGRCCSRRSRSRRS